MDAPVVVPSEEDALAFLATGRIPGRDAPADADRRAYLRACLKVPAFRERAWPHFACFVDASNVARRRPVPAHESNTPKARLADLDAVVDALRALKYVPIVVSDANLFQLIDEPYEYKRKYTEYPHSVAERRQADSIVLRALRKLPEAACVTNDRFSKPDEARDFPDVLALRGCFFRHRWDSAVSPGPRPPGIVLRNEAGGDAPRFVDAQGAAMPTAHARLVARLAAK